jgi:hypothetical protein
MEWSLPPGRAGRAPQASRHNRTAEAAAGGGVGGAIGWGGRCAAGLASGAVVAAGAVGPGLPRLADSVTDVEHPPTMAATPAPPASRRTRRRLTSSGQPPFRRGGSSSMRNTIEARSSKAAPKRKATGLRRTHSATPAERGYPTGASRKLFASCVGIFRIPVCHWRTAKCSLDIGSRDCSVAGEWVRSIWPSTPGCLAVMP